MKALLAVILIGFWALPRGQTTCLLPIICSDETGITGALLCDEFCFTIGAGAATCTVIEWASYAECRCAGPRSKNIVTNEILRVYSLAWPSVCDAACLSCSKLTGDYELTDSNNSSPVVAVCRCDDP